MKKVFYDNWLAKHILLAGYSTITLMAWVFTKLNKEEVQQSTINHECTHARQWIELTVVSGLLIWIALLVWDYSACWLVLSALTFYVWYVLEYLVRRFIGIFRNGKNGQKAAYRLVSFEQEARLAEKDNNYLENSTYFAWLRFY